MLPEAKLPGSLCHATSPSVLRTMWRDRQFLNAERFPMLRFLRVPAKSGSLPTRTGGGATSCLRVVPLLERVNESLRSIDKWSLCTIRAVTHGNSASLSRGRRGCFEGESVRPDVHTLNCPLLQLHRFLIIRYNLYNYIYSLLSTYIYIYIPVSCRSSGISMAFII